MGMWECGNGGWLKNTLKKQATRKVTIMKHPLKNRKTTSDMIETETNAARTVAVKTV